MPFKSKAEHHMPAIYVHLKSNDLGCDLVGRHLALYRVIRDLAQVEGIVFAERLRDRDISVGTHSVMDGRFDDGNLHIIDDRSVQAPGVLNATVAYLWEFWQLDPRGLKAFSSTVDRAFDPTSVSPERVQRFRETLWERYVVPRKSKNTQNQAAADLPDNALALFFQGDYPLKTGASDMSDLLMLDTVQKQAGDHPIVVKTHPSASAEQDIEGLKAAARHDPRIHVTEANVHDILARARATVSVNSTVALEGFLHAKPAILFGLSDFHHIAGRVHRPSDFGAVLAEQLDRDIPYDQFLAWFFLKACIPIRGRSLSDRIWQQFANVGFAKDRFVKD